MLLRSFKRYAHTYTCTTNVCIHDLCETSPFPSLSPLSNQGGETGLKIAKIELACSSNFLIQGVSRLPI